MGLITNVKVYGMDETLIAAKFPMSVDIESLDSSITKGVEHLAKSGIGEGHDQMLTGITVQFNLMCTNKMWVEVERYRFLYFVSSQSTMHRIAKFNLAEAYIEHVDDRVIEIMKALVCEYNQMPEGPEKTEMYLKILYTNPSGFKLTARMTTNYRQLKTIYQQRKKHRLPEWREFCEWIETLPNSDFIVGDAK